MNKQLIKRIKASNLSKEDKKAIINIIKSDLPVEEKLVQYFKYLHLGKELLELFGIDIDIGSFF